MAMGAASAIADSPAIASVCIDRKSTRLNSSHDQISYAVFCLKKKKRVIAFLFHKCTVWSLLVSPESFHILFGYSGSFRNAPQPATLSKSIVQGMISLMLHHS